MYSQTNGTGIDKNNKAPKNKRDDHEPGTGHPQRDNKACLLKKMAVTITASHMIKRKLNFPSDISMVYLNNGNEPYNHITIDTMSKMICVAESFIFDR